MTHFDAATAAVEAAIAAGARYADARVMHRRTESMSALKREIEDLSQAEDAGVGVRALVGSGWGFYAVPDLSASAARAAGARAAAIAAASAQVAGAPVELVGTGGGTVATWASECEIDPLSVPLSEKGDLLVSVTGEMHRAGGDQSRGSYDIWDTRKWFVSSEGHRIDQHFRECGGGITTTVVGDGETQRRSYPAYRGQFGTVGWEMMHRIDLPAHATRVVEEARALLTAPLCPAGETTLILGDEQMS